MARALEIIGKEILKKNKIPIPECEAAKSVDQACGAAERIGYPVVIKALITVGKRGKAGAVKFANNRSEVEKAAKEILNMTVRNFPVDQLLIEQKLDISKELYFSITYDSTKKTPVIIASSEGGVDIEEIAEKHPDKVFKIHVDPIRGFEQYQAKELASGLGLKEKQLVKGAILFWRLYNVFRDYDATILEINPIVITGSGELVAAAILFGVDDDALYRQSDLSGRVESGSDRSWRPLTELEKQMVAVDEADAYRGTARYTEMEGGDIGFLCGGGGGSLLAFDALLAHGGQPANYTELGGNPPQNKVAGLVKGVLSKPGVKSLFVALNITNNTQTDVLANGIVQAFDELGVDPAKFATVARLAGVNDNEARSIASQAGIEYYGDEVTIDDAARIMCDKVKSMK